MKNYAQAEICFSRLTQLNPAHGDYWGLLGQMRCYQGKNAEAIPAYEEALRRGVGDMTEGITHKLAVLKAQVSGSRPPGGSTSRSACRSSSAGRECRGLRTERYTYIRDLHGPWLLFDNRDDPYQMTNLVSDQPQVVGKLDSELSGKLRSLGDEFLAGEEYFRRFKIRLNSAGDTFYE